MMKTLALAIALTTTQAHAFTLSILTNQDSQAKANEVKSFMETLPPFKYMSSSELKITVTKIDSSEIAQSCSAIKLKYTKEELRSISYWAQQNGATVTHDEEKNLENGFSISRNVTCDKDALAKLAQRYGGDRTLVVIEREGSRVRRHRWDVSA